jgi:hypothetical protein
MASRPVFIPEYQGRNLVEERNFEFKWAPGFAEIQKKKNIASLHSAALSGGVSHILEISSKSDDELGRRLSAFSLKIEIGNEKYPLESVYQGSKVFSNSGPFPEIFQLDPRSAKRFIRDLGEINLIGFNFNRTPYPLYPKNAFYDWLYIRSLIDHSDWIKRKVEHAAFTDIEFNPTKQVNCQARAFATYLSLSSRGELQSAASDFDYFSSMLSPV